jgi:ribulose-5-phosphate 4-epimerase/fuculose-1-phosphate aldolase
MSDIKAAEAGAGADCSPAEWEVRCELAACYQLVDLYGMSELTSNHISMRVPGPDDHFLLNPYGWLYDEITASSLIKVDVNGKVISGTDRQMNFAGFVIHSAIHMSFPHLACVIHTHTTANNAVAMQKHGLLPLSQKALLISDFVCYHDYEGGATNLDERQRIVRDLSAPGEGEKRIMILRNHGALTVGRTAGEAFAWMYWLEIACRQQVAGLSANTELIELSPEVIAHTRAQGRRLERRVPSTGSNAEQGFQWPALLRKLERERGASYRT